MADTRSTNLRFNLDKELHRKAWNYLQIRDQEKFPSYSQTVIIALVDYFGRYYAAEEIETQNEQLAQTIAKAVEQTIKTSLPPFLDGYFAAAAKAGQPLQHPAEDPDPPQMTPSDKDIDWDYLQGV